jgi:hypothetical protein
VAVGYKAAGDKLQSRGPYQQQGAKLVESDNSAQKSGISPTADIVDLLDTEARLLAYLRTTMLESGDDPQAIAAALANIDTARARLKAKPLRVTAITMERVTKRLP